MTKQSSELSPAFGNANALVFDHVQRELSAIESRVDEKLKQIEIRFTELVERNVQSLSLVVSKDIEKRMLESQLALNTVRSDIMAQLNELKERLISLHHENEIAIQNLSNDVETFRVTADQCRIARQKTPALIPKDRSNSNKDTDSYYHLKQVSSANKKEKSSFIEKYVLPNLASTVVALLVSGVANMVLYIGYQMMKEQDRQLSAEKFNALNREKDQLNQKLDELIRVLHYQQAIQQKAQNGNSQK